MPGLAITKVISTKKKLMTQLKRIQAANIKIIELLGGEYNELKAKEKPRIVQVKKLDELRPYATQYLTNEELIESLDKNIKALS